MRGIVSEYELEALPELGDGYGAQELYSAFGEVDVQHGRRPRHPLVDEALDLIRQKGLRDLLELTDEMFFRRHPERRGTPLKKGEAKLIGEWRRLRAAASAALSIDTSRHLGGNRESEQFFGALASLARRGAGWLTQPGSPQRRAALTIARQAINRGVPALGRWTGGQAPSWLGGLVPQQEYEWESELEISPIRKIYPDAMMEHLGHAAAESHGEAEAETLAGALIPLAARVVPQAAPTLMRAMPGLASGVAGVVRSLHRDPVTRPLVRVVPAIVRGTAANIAQNASRGVEMTPQAAVRALALQTLRMLGSPQASARAFRRSRVLDGQFHRRTGIGQPAGAYGACPSCSARMG
jgi:hypothetical protein